MTSQDTPNLPPKHVKKNRNWEKRFHCISTRITHSEFEALDAFAKSREMSLSETVRMFIQWGMEVERKEHENVNSNRT
jgi:hypothetical protein